MALNVSNICSPKFRLKERGLWFLGSKLTNETLLRFSPIYLTLVKPNLKLFASEPWGLEKNLLSRFLRAIIYLTLHTLWRNQAQF